MYEKNVSASKNKSSNIKYLTPPSDPFNLVYIICLILGCGTLLAYNVLVSCATYFNQQYTDYPSIMFTIVPVYSIPNLLFIIFMIPFGDKFSWTIKILGCFIIVGILIFIVPFITSSSLNQHISYLLFLIITVIIGSASAILQCSIIAFCGLLPLKYFQTLMGGQAVSGILVCIIRIFSKLFIPTTTTGIEQSGMIYFMVSAFVSLVCAIAFYWAKRSTFVRHHVYTNTKNDPIGIKYEYVPKFKKIMISRSPSNENILHRDVAHKHRKKHNLEEKYSSSSTEEIVDYHLNINAPIVHKQIVGKDVNRNAESFSYDTHIQQQYDGSFTVSVVNPQTVTLPVLVRQDTPHTLARFVRGIGTKQDTHGGYIAQLLSPSASSVSFIDDDLVLTPYHTGQKQKEHIVQSYGSVNFADDDDRSLSKEHKKIIKQKQNKLFSFKSRKKSY